MKTLPESMLIHMPDRSVWSVPVDVIARDRAQYYAHEFDGDVERSLREDTIPLFIEDHFQIEDWAANNMNWKDVEWAANLVRKGCADYNDGWSNGRKEFI